MRKTFLSLILFGCFVAFSSAQSIKVISGSLDFLKEQQVLKFEFTYDNMQVGKLTEQEYVDKKVYEKGSAWQKAWISDRANRFEPKFLELFDKIMKKKGISSGDEGAHYVFVVNTDFTEPGWNVGVMRSNASINLTCNVLDIASGEEVAVIAITRASANDFMGTDFDTAYRIQESYAKAGRELAKFLIKKGQL